MKSISCLLVSIDSAIICSSRWSMIEKPHDPANAIVLARLSGIVEKSAIAGKSRLKLP